ncbi:hypothetical protein N3K66_006499 [Trichothecium roseum]|uniref:Uncharacterized protein n=1 Tax=Trichothecium roseum TaxID=47278 RepID=A0ACC0UVM8_9HYPO|nr:hypothetical protein N3K66_006499 [Trichothecium roseum]
MINRPLLSSVSSFSSLVFFSLQNIANIPSSSSSSSSSSSNSNDTYNSRFYTTTTTTTTNTNTNITSTMFGVSGVLRDAMRTAIDMAQQARPNGGMWAARSEVASVVGFFGSFYSQLEHMCQHMLSYGGSSASNLSDLDQHIGQMRHILSPGRDTAAPDSAEASLTTLFVQRCRLVAVTLSGIYSAETFSTMIARHPSILDTVDFNLTPEMRGDLGEIVEFLSAPALPAICQSITNAFGLENSELNAATMDDIIVDIGAMHLGMALPTFLAPSGQRSYEALERVNLDGTPDFFGPGSFPEPMELTTPSGMSQHRPIPAARPSSPPNSSTLQSQDKVKDSRVGKQDWDSRTARGKKNAEVDSLDAQIKGQYIRERGTKEPMTLDAAARSKLHPILKKRNAKSRKTRRLNISSSVKSARFVSGTLSPPPRETIRRKLSNRFWVPLEDREEELESDETQSELPPVPQGCIESVLQQSGSASTDHPSYDFCFDNGFHLRPAAHAPHSTISQEKDISQTDIAHVSQQQDPFVMTPSLPEQAIAHSSTRQSQLEVSSGSDTLSSTQQVPSSSEHVTALESPIEEHIFSLAQVEQVTAHSPIDQEQLVAPMIGPFPQPMEAVTYTSAEQVTAPSEMSSSIPEHVTAPHSFFSPEHVTAHPSSPSEQVTASDISSQGQLNAPTEMSSSLYEHVTALQSSFSPEHVTASGQAPAHIPSTQEQVTAPSSFISEQLQAPIDNVSTHEQVTAPTPAAAVQPQTPNSSFLTRLSSWWQPWAPLFTQHAPVQPALIQPELIRQPARARDTAPTQQPAEGMQVDPAPANLSDSQYLAALQASLLEMDDDEPTPSRQLILEEMAAVSAHGSRRQSDSDWPPESEETSDPRDETANLLDGLFIHQRPASRFLDLFKSQDLPTASPERDDDDSELAPVTPKEEIQVEEEKHATAHETILEIFTHPSDKPLAISSEQQASILREKEEEEARIAEELRKAEEEARRIAEEEAKRQLKERLALSGGLRLPNQLFVAPLSAEWEAKAKHTVHASHTTTLATTNEGVELRCHDFAKLVQETEWLNDEVINASLNFLDSSINLAAGIKDVKRNTRKCLAMNSFFYKRLKDHGVKGTERSLRRYGVERRNILDIETILLPICENSHWTLCVIRPAARTVAHMDSLNPRGSPVVTQTALSWLEEFLEKFDANEWKVVVHDAPRQTNGWDCGVHTITNAMCVSLGISPIDCYSSTDLPLQRLRIACVLLNQGFKDDFDLSVF